MYMLVWHEQFAFVRRHGKQILLTLLSLGLIGVAITQIETRDLGGQLANFPPVAIGLVLAMLILNLAAVWLRFWRMLGHIGYRLQPGDAWYAFLQGQLASLFVIQLVGQMAGRGLALVRFGVSPSALAALSVYERGTLFVSSSAMAMIGAMHLLGLAVADEFLRRFHLAEIVGVILVAVGVSMLLGRSRREARLAEQARSMHVMGKLVVAMTLTLLGQVFMLAAFMIAALAVHPEADMLNVLAASAVVSFMASLPISVNGWGVREVAAIALLGPLGFSSAEALAVSILIGICATLVMLVPMPLLLRQQKTPVHVAHITFGAQTFDRLAAWTLGGMAAFLILFQFHAKFSFGDINVNLADPLALLGLGAVAIAAVLYRQVPRWRVPGINIWVACASLIMLLGFVIGVWHIGVTAWAFSNRLLGWFVLLGYAALGAWFVQMNGRHGLRRLMDYLAACAVAIVLAQIALRMLAVLSGEVSSTASQFMGYAGNRNAFAFQMLACMAGLLAWSPLRARHGRTRLHDLALAIVLTGLVLTQSRAALGTAALLLTAAGWLHIADRGTLARSVGIAALLLALVFPFYFLQTPASYEGLLARGYDSLRWDSLRAGLHMWEGAPFFGAGLGVFMHESARLFPLPMVVHSTPIWWLAEFGLAGFIVFAGGLVGLIIWGGRHINHMPARFVIMLAFVFAMFGLVHDIFAQRIFWFLLGAVLALPLGAPHDQNTRRETEPCAA